MTTIVPRNRDLKKVEKFIDRPFIKVLTGVRRYGGEFR